MGIPVFFSESMVATSSSFSPSAGKPAQVVASWRALGLALEWNEPQPATTDEIKRAHDPAFVEDVLACRRQNGFGDTSPEVARALPFTTGAMLSAARYVLRTGAPVAAAPCSGFHHARWASAAGFCTFNGLMVTACNLWHDGSARRVGILDCDTHYGDGTDQILGVLPDASFVEHWTAGARFQHAHQAVEFLAELPSVVRRMSGCDVVLYQAGADPHVNDPLGGWLTTEQLRRRDAIVFETLHELGVPVVWNLAGGYQREPDGSIPAVLEIHDNTMRECARIFGDPALNRRAGS
jgi:acetoin utilization deacetylase AcuC-like enzyme